MSELINDAPIFDPGEMRDYGDYLGLLGRDFREPDDAVDAIIVPQGRPAECIRPAAKLARASGAMLISLCSHQARAGEVAEVLDAMPDGPESWYAVDVPPGYQVPGVGLKAEHEIPDAASKDPGWNLSDKRNAGLVIGRMTGAESIFFCDDDQRINPEAVRSASQLIFRREIAGLSCGGFPDKSMIMHAAAAVVSFHYPNKLLYRSRYSRRGSVIHMLNAGQISANSMAVNPGRTDGHFPRLVYNEDWLFAYDSIRRHRAALSEHKYFQEEYDPFVVARAEQEEFGDVVIDGLYGDLKENRAGADTGGQMDELAYWQSKIEERRRQYEFLLTAITSQRNDKLWNFGMMDKSQWKNVTMPAEWQERLRAPLRAGLAVNEALDGDMFVGYMRAWQGDQGRWKRMLGGLPREATVKDAMTQLELTDYVSSE